MTAYESGKLAEVLTKCGAARTERKKGDFSADDIEVDLRTLLGTSLETVQFLDTKLAMSALAAMIRFAHLLEQPALEGNVTLKKLDHNSFMKLGEKDLYIFSYPSYRTCTARQPSTTYH